MNFDKKLFKHENRYETAFLIFLCVLEFILYHALTNSSFLVRFNDYGAHIRIAMRIVDFNSFYAQGYPLWHLVTKIITVLGIHKRQAAGISSGFFAVLAVIFLYKLLVYLLREREKTNISRNFILILVAVILVVGPIYMPWFNKNLYLGQGTINVYHNPTSIAVKPFVFISLYYFIKIIDDFMKDKAKNKDFILLSIVLFLSVLAKPSFMQFFIFAAFAVVIPLSVKKRSLSFFIKMIIVFLPSILWMASILFSAFTVFGQSASKGRKGHEVYIKFNGYTKSNLISLLLFIGFPLWVTICRLRTLKYDVPLVLSWLGLICAYLQMLLLHERGRESHGNFGWGYLAAGAALWAVTISRFAQSYLNEDFRHPAHYVSFALLSAHIIAGIFFLRYVLITGLYGM